MNWFGKQVWIPVVAGFLLSGFLYLWTYTTHSAILYWPQAIGFWVSFYVWGVHSGTDAEFATVVIPVNAVIYAWAILIVGMFWKKAPN